MLSFALALSYHLGGEDYDLNWLHPHVRYTTEQEYLIGAYYNSEYDVSLYVGKKYNNIELGLVTGYSDTVIPYLRYTEDGFFVAPAFYGDDKELGLVLGYEVGF